MLNNAPPTPPIILHLCADIGSDSKPYADAGYDVRLIGKGIGVENYTPPENVRGVFANPVCTEFSIASGFSKRGNHELGLFLVNHCKRIIREARPDWWVIENPASGRLKDYLGAPRMTYEPWHFGSPWTKATALWGEFKCPIPKYNQWGQVPKNDKLYVRPGRPKPSLAFMHKSAQKHIPEFAGFHVEDDMSFRSLCSQHFAQAFLEVNP